jgi:hypothetical protein
MGIYNFICGPRSYDAFPKWPARSFGLATPGLDNVGLLTSHNPIGLHGLLRGELYFTLAGQFMSDIEDEKILSE